ncbi:MAG TPA: YHYH protein, partial [Verrucomicrobiae bacterium]|nr:YHYH protein [Verrucomicrobiae bacterium]
MKTTLGRSCLKLFCRLAVLIGLHASINNSAATVDPRTNSWFTTYSGQYARIYTNNTMKAAGAPLTTWSNGSQSQSAPAYCGVQEVDSSSNWVYVFSTGLAGYNMGPWQNGAFPNLPVNQKLLYRFPRTNSVPATKTLTGGGQIGIFVDGVEMFNSWDAFYWDGTADTPSMGGNTGYWNRDAYVNEGATFDAGNAHQQNSGTYHYHANPIGLRYQLGDHVDYDSSTKTYSESTNGVGKHSPILGWVGDGFPIYGPYGYSNATNPATGMRRMISGYVIRNGQYGTSNLTANGRATIPQWAVRAFGVTSNQSGPAVSSTYPLGRYMEDNDYLGDHGYAQGVDFDLDEYNGRWCVTPEFPSGTYAYFVSISPNGTPTFPYNIGRAYYGSATGGSAASIAETVVTNFVGGPNGAFSLGAPAVDAPTVTLTWSSVDGGTYQIESSTNLANWNTNMAGVASQGISTRTNLSSGAAAGYYRVARTALANFDPVTGTVSGGGGGQTITLTPNAGSRGQNNIGITAVISASATPAVPPHTGAPVQTFTIGTMTVSGASYTYNGSTGTVTGT